MRIPMPCQPDPVYDLLAPLPPWPESVVDDVNLMLPLPDLQCFSLFEALSGVVCDCVKGRVD